MDQLNQPAESPRLPLRPAGSVKRSFVELDCRGVYDRKAFYELAAVCDDCFQVYQNSEVYGLCRSACFTSRYFGDCLVALQESSKADRLSSVIQRISGRK